MKTNRTLPKSLSVLHRLCWFAAVLIVSTLRAADAAPAPAEAERIIAAVRAADDERVAATQAGDRTRLDAILSDALRYGHSSARIDTKASLVESLVARTAVYEGYEYRERKFSPVGPGIVVMTGRAVLRVRDADGYGENDLIFLAVWREENGRWRFLAWQSCHIPEPAAAAK